MLSPAPPPSSRETMNCPPLSRDTESPSHTRVFLGRSNPSRTRPPSAPSLLHVGTRLSCTCVHRPPVCFPSQSHPDPVTYSGRITRCLSSTAGKLWEGGHPGRALSPPLRKRLAPLGGRPGPICRVLWTRGHSVQHRRWAGVSGWGQG